MKIGKIENDIPISSVTTQLFLNLKVKQSILIKPSKGETITWLRKHLSATMYHFKNGTYKYHNKMIFTQRIIYENENQIGIRIWRVK